MKTTIICGNNIMRPVAADQNGKAENLHSAATHAVKSEKQRMVATEKRCAVERRQITYGYIRVSTREQNEARQLDAMKNFGVDQMVMDKQSGKDFDRPAYQRLIGMLRPEDMLVVKSIDRLGRNYSEILEQWRIITREIGADIVVLDMELLDTRRGRDLTGTLIADIVLQLLSYVAETERTFIKQRQAEGIAAAKARGQKFGRPCKERGEKYESLLIQWREGKISANEAGRQLGVIHKSFLRWARENDKKTS